MPKIVTPFRRHPLQKEMSVYIYSGFEWTVNLPALMVLGQKGKLEYMMQVLYSMTAPMGTPDSAPKS